MSHVLHFDRVPSTGQQCALQTLVSVRTGQGGAPQLGCRMIERVCDWEPPPQVTEHVVNPSKSDTMQTSSQQCVLQAALPTSAGQTDPPYAGGTTTERVRCFVPVPQLAVHWPKLPQFDMTQSIGHG